MDNGFLKEDLKWLGVYQLRELAREMGASSATTKKKEELIEEIIKLKSKEQEPAVNLQKRRGRPPNSSKKQIPLIKSLIPEEIIKLAQENNKVEEPTPLYTQFLTLSQDFKRLSDDNEVYKVSGFLKFIDQDTYYITFKDVDIFTNVFVYVPNEVVNKYSLRLGDKIEAVAYKLKDRTYSLIKNVLKINGCLVEHFNRKNIDIQNYLIPSKHIEILGNQLKKGERYYSVLNDRIDAIQKLIDYIDKHIETKFVLYGLDVSPEIIHFARTRDNIELFLTHFSDDIKDSYEKTVDCFRYCTSLLRDGNDIVLFVFDALSTTKALNSYFSKEEILNEYGNNVKAIKELKRIIGLGSDYGDSTLTNVTFYFEDSPLLTELKLVYKDEIKLG